MIDNIQTHHGYPIYAMEAQVEQLSDGSVVLTFTYTPNPFKSGAPTKIVIPKSTAKILASDIMANLKPQGG